jgi:translation initiation factor IF-2
MNAKPAEHDAEWPLRCEISRLQAQVGHLLARVAHEVARCSSLTASRGKAQATTLELQRIIRAAAGVEPSDRVVALAHSGRLLRDVLRDRDALRARVLPAEAAAAQVADLHDALAASERRAAYADGRALDLREQLQRERAERDAAQRAERLAAASDEVRAELEAELRAELAAELAAVEQRTARALAAAEERVTAAAGMAAEAQARATKAIRSADDRAERARKAARDGVAAAEAAATEAAERKARAAEAKLRRELDTARAEAVKLEAGRAMLEREVAGARLEVDQHRRRPIPAAPREPLLAVLATGARSVTSHRARLAGWAAGEGADVEAARALAVVVRDDAAPAEVRLRAQTALAGLLGGVR